MKKFLIENEVIEKNLPSIAVLATLDFLRHKSPAIAEKIIQELRDQRTHLKLIASENYSSLGVQLAMGNWLTDKYAEGIPFSRFYAGCENVDAIEQRAIDLVKKIFNCEHAYVQPHSGADANLIAFWAILLLRIQNKELEHLGKKGIDALSDEEHESLRRVMLSQKVMGMALGSGGHLTHGYRHNISAKFMHSVFYDVDPISGLIDYKALEEKAKKEKPLILIAGYSAYPRCIDFEKMRSIADSAGAVLLVDMAHFAGLVAGKVMQGPYNPIPYAHIVTSTTHKTLRGPRGGLILCKEEFKEVINKGCPLVMGGPLPHVMAAKAIAFEEASSSLFCEYAHQIVKNAKALAEQFLKKEVEVLTGGTDNHMVLLNVARSFSLTGRQAELALREAGMTVNRNAIPFDPNGPWYTSGIRLGSPALTTRGMKEQEMQEIAELICLLLSNTQAADAEEGQKSRAKVVIDPKVLKMVKQRVHNLLEQFPLYPELKLDF